MPTRDRRRFVSQAIWYFLRQDYPSRELIVVDDGVDTVEDLIPCDSRIRYIRNGPAAAGSKFTLGCEVAEGEFIVHWDDDAWYSPNRLTAQLRYLKEYGARATGLAGMLHYQPLTGRLWQHCSEGRSSSLQPGTLVYRRDYWEAHRFPDAERPGGSQFVHLTRGDGFIVQEDPQFAAVILHGSNTGSVNPANPCWEPRDFAELERVLGPDLSFYSAAEGKRPSARRAASRSARGMRHTEVVPITLAATFMVYDGYGSMAEYLALGMERAGAEVHVAPFHIDAAAASPEFQELLKRSRPDPQGVVLAHAWWGEDLARFGSAQDLFIKTVWETSQLPRDWPSRLNKARAVIVPSDFAARVFRDSGVRVPVEVAYEGIDPDVYPYVDRPERKGVTTLIVGVLAPRKNYQQAVAAWQMAFADDPDARLILKARFQIERFAAEDPRIQVVDCNETTRGILHWYRQADILLALGNEGFGLPVIEGMATGLPVVALDAEAQADVVAVRAAGSVNNQGAVERDERMLVLPVKVASWEQVDSPAFGPAGVRALPDVEDAARQLRWVAHHRAEAREMGRRASAWAHANRNVWEMGPATLAAIERHARTPSPLRRTYALWAAVGGEVEDGASAVRLEDSYGRAVEHYAQNVARNVSQARFYASPPMAAASLASGSAWRSPILHVHVSPGSVADEALTQQVQAARQNGMAVIITEHGRSTDGRAHAWEQLADVLVALDAETALGLSGLWPFKRVEILPPGCPRWRPSDRSRGGRVIAVIAPQASADVHTEMSELANSLNASWLAVPLPSSALADDGEALVAWLNSRADVVLCIRDAGATGQLESIALASGLPVVAIDRSAPARAHGSTDACEPGSRVGRTGGRDLRSTLFTATVDPVYRPKILPAGLQEVLDSPARRAELAGAAQAYCAELSWQQIAAHHLALWRTVMA